MKEFTYTRHDAAQALIPVERTATATGSVSERLTVVFRAEGIDGLQRATVELINGYSTRDDVEKIIAIRRGVKPDGITIYSMATI